MRNKVVVLLMFYISIVGCQKQAVMVCEYKDVNLKTTYTISSKNDIISKVKILNIYDMKKIGYELQVMNELFADTSDRIKQKGIKYSSKIENDYGEEVIDINLEDADLEKVENASLLYSPLEEKFKLKKLVDLLESNNFVCQNTK